VLTHALEDPYNVDHPAAAAFAQQARIIAQAMGHKPQADYSYSAPPVFLFEPHQAGDVQFQTAASSISTRSGISSARRSKYSRDRSVAKAS